MFHNSTTIWHKPKKEKNLSQERRVIFSLGGALLAVPSVMWGATRTTAGIGGKFVKLNYNIGKWGMQAPFKLIGVDKVLKMGWDNANKAVYGAEWSSRVTKEGAMGIGVDAIGKSIGDLAFSPLVYTKRLFVDNSRDVFEDLLTLKTPKNIIKSPLNFGKSIKQGISDSRTEYANIIKDAASFKPFSAINSTRKALTSTLAIPFKGVWGATRPILDTPIKMGYNVYNAHKAFPQAIWRGPTQHWPKGISRLKNAPATATKEMSEEENRIHMMNVLKEKREKYGTGWTKGKDWTNKQWGKFTGNATKEPETPQPIPATP